MNKRALLVVLVLAFAVGLAISVGTGTSTADAPGVTANNWTFQGCWAYSGGGQCYDVYTDASGGHYICKACGTTGNPSKGKCNPISQATLDSGRWCS
jgi:hypothetical protein